MERRISDADAASPERSALKVVRSIAEDTSSLIRKEFELARIELLEALNARLRAMAAIMMGAILGMMMMVFLGLALESALQNVMPEWAARLTVAGAALAVAGMAAMVALRWLRTPSMMPEETKRTVKEDVEWVRAQLRR